MKTMEARMKTTFKLDEKAMILLITQENGMGEESSIEIHVSDIPTFIEQLKEEAGINPR
jgi:hypothetical protein